MYCSSAIVRSSSRFLYTVYCIISLLLRSLPRRQDPLGSLFLVSFSDSLHRVSVVVLNQDASLPAPRRQPDGFVARVLRGQILLRVGTRNEARE